MAYDESNGHMTNYVTLPSWEVNSWSKYAQSPVCRKRLEI